MKYKCENCDHDLFIIEKIDSCLECRHNGIWDDKNCKYIYTGYGERTQAHDEGECELGHCFANGCHLYVCSKCGVETNLPITGYY